MNQEDADQEFSIPSEMVDKLYELSGGVDKYKGIIMAVSTDAGRPLIYQRFDCGMTELALSKALEDFLSREDSEIKKEDDQEGE
jgi:hypothetical protein|tara:strand:+ start:12938 stop:13189 length:252 start_codon:yes stop_codon:yes gene_type:complete